MPWIERIRTEQPLDAGVGIDWGNPTSRSLAFAWDAASKSMELTAGLSAGLDQTSSAVNKNGLAAQCSSGQKNIEWNKQFITTSDGTGDGDFTMLVVADPAATGAGSAEHVFDQKNDAAGAPYAQAGLLAHSGARGAYTSGAFSFFTYRSTDSEVSAAGACDGLEHVWIGVRRAGTLYLYKDGVLLASGAGFNGSLNISQASRYTAVGSAGNATAGAYRNKASMARAWNRALSAAEVVSLSANPWQLFEKERVWVPVPVDTRAKTYLSRIRTEQPVDAARIAPEYASRVVDGFVGAGGLTLKGKPIDETAYITKTPSAMGMGRRGTSNAGFSFPCDLSSMGAITLVFQFIQHSRSGIQMLVEHSANANSNHGTFFIYTDTGTDSLVVGTQSWGSYDYGSIALPALDRVTTLAVRMKTSTAGAAGDLEVWVNGAAQTLTPDASAYLDYTFENYSTYFLGRGGLTYLADATVGMYVAMSGTVSDATMKGVSTNPWQLFENEQVRLLPLVVAGSDATTTQASGVSTAGSLAGAAGTAGVCSAAAGTSTPSGLVGSGTVSTTITQTDGVSTAGLLSGVATSSTSIGQVAGISTAETLTGSSSSFATANSAAGASAASAVSAASSSTSVPDASPGASTAASLAAFALSVSALSVSAGASTTESLAGSTANGSVFTRADGISTASALAASAATTTIVSTATGNSSAPGLTGASAAGAAPAATAGATTASVLGGSTSNGSATTQADGVSTAGTLGATAAAAANGAQADGISTASVFVATVSAAATPTTADGASTTSTLVGVGSAAGSSGIMAADGISVATALTSNASVAATVTTAHGASSTAGMVGGSGASAAPTAADGITASGTLVGAGIAPTVASIAAGSSSVAALVAGAAASTNTAQADGLSNTPTLAATATATADISLSAGSSSTSALGASGNAPADVTAATGSTTTSTLGGVATHVAVLAGAAGASTASAFATSAVAATIAIAAASVSSARALAGTPPNTAGASGVVHEIAAENRTSAIGTDVRTSTVLFGERWATVTI